MQAKFNVGDKRQSHFCICTLSNLLSRTRKTEAKFLIVFNSNAMCFEESLIAWPTWLKPTDFSLSWSLSKLFAYDDKITCTVNVYIWNTTLYALCRAIEIPTIMKRKQNEASTLKFEVQNDRKLVVKFLIVFYRQCYMCFKESNPNAWQTCINMFYFHIHV